jgi:hypothetical protein
VRKPPSKCSRGNHQCYLSSSRPSNSKYGKSGWSLFLVPTVSVEVASWCLSCLFCISKSAILLSRICILFSKVSLIAGSINIWLGCDLVFVFLAATFGGSRPFRFLELLLGGFNSKLFIIVLIIAFLNDCQTTFSYLLIIVFIHKFTIII